MQNGIELQALIADYGRLRRLEGYTPQSRGQRLNDVIAAMLRCWGMNAQSSVRAKGEVDVAFTADGTRYVVEAKWENRPADTGHIAKLQKRVRQRMAGTYGIFVSMAGYTTEALADVADGDRLEILLLDAEHFEAMLSGLVPPQEMLNLLRDRAAFFGDAYTPLLTLIGAATDPPQVAFGNPSLLPEGLVQWASEGVTGEVLFTLPGANNLGIAAEDDGRLLVTTEHGIIRVDVQTRAVRWAVPITGCRRNPAVQADGAVLFARRNGIGRYTGGKLTVIGGGLSGSTCLAPHPEGSMWAFANGSINGHPGASITRLGDALGDEVRHDITYPPSSAFTSAWISQHELLTIGPEFLITRIGSDTVRRHQANQTNPMGMVSLGDGTVVTAGDSVTLGRTDLDSGAYTPLARLALQPSVNELCLGSGDSIYIASFYGDGGVTPIAVGRISVAPVNALHVQERLDCEAQRAASPGVLYILVCGLPTARDVGTLVNLAQRDGWEVCVITTPDGRGHVDVAALQSQTGHPVRSHRGDLDDTNQLPPADAMIVAPATVNTINKWVAGITDTLVLSLLGQGYGYGIPVVVVPFPNKVEALHPRFQNSLAELLKWGVQVLYGDDVVRLGGPGQEERFRSQFPWERALRELSPAWLNPEAQGEGFCGW